MYMCRTIYMLVYMLAYIVLIRVSEITLHVSEKIPIESYTIRQAQFFY